MANGETPGRGDTDLVRLAQQIKPSGLIALATAAEAHKRGDNIDDELGPKAVLLLSELNRELRPTLNKLTGWMERLHESGLVERETERRLSKNEIAIRNADNIIVQWSSYSTIDEFTEAFGEAIEGSDLRLVDSRVRGDAEIDFRDTNITFYSMFFPSNTKNPKRHRIVRVDNCYHLFPKRVVGR